MIIKNDDEERWIPDWGRCYPTMEADCCIMCQQAYQEMIDWAESPEGQEIQERMRLRMLLKAQQAGES